jgi:hypothetical protein
MKEVRVRVSKSCRAKYHDKYKCNWSGLWIHTRVGQHKEIRVSILISKSNKHNSLQWLNERSSNLCSINFMYYWTRLSTNTWDTYNDE